MAVILSPTFSYRQPLGGGTNTMPTDNETGEDNSTEATPQLAQFEASLSELETLVEALEAGDIGLEEALAKFERGVVLTRQCRNLLKNAELRVDQLLAENGTPQELKTTAEGSDNGTTG